MKLNAQVTLRGAATIIGSPREKLRDSKHRQHLRREFNHLLINYLSSFRLYLDQMAKRLTDRYGQESAQFEVFETARKHAYDTTPEYRIIYKARDFVVHCGMLVMSVQFSEGLNSDEAVDHRVSVDCGRDALLERWKGWGQRARADIQAQLERFPANLMFAPATRVLFGVDTAVMEAERPALLESAERVVRLVAEVPESQAKGVGFTEINKTVVGQNFKFVHIPTNVIGWLGLPYERIVQF